jgi:molybdate transport system substrate-binding protein
VARVSTRSLLALGTAAALGLGPASGQTAAPSRQVTVAAAADLKFAMDDLVQEFAKRRPDVGVRVTYGSSGNFFSQLSNGAPFDLFLSADVDYVRRLAAAGLTLPESDFVYAVGRIVLWAPRASAFDPSRGIGLLAEPSVRRVAIANPRHAPYGRAAEAALKALGIYGQMQAKLVFGEDVAQTAQFVQAGAADVGIIALSLALAPTLASEGRFWEIPIQSYPRIEQGGVVMKATKDIEGARAFREVVLGPAGRSVLKRYGFFLPGE